MRSVRVEMSPGMQSGKEHPSFLDFSLNVIYYRLLPRHPPSGASSSSPPSTRPRQHRNRAQVRPGA